SRDWSSDVCSSHLTTDPAGGLPGLQGGQLDAAPGACLLTGALDGLGGQQSRVDLAQRDRERLLVDVRVDEGTDVLEETLTELRVVRVDLAGPLGRVDHEAVLRVRGLEELVGRRVDDALGRGDGRGHALPSDGRERCYSDDHLSIDQVNTTFTTAS